MRTMRPSPLTRRCLDGAYRLLIVFVVIGFGVRALHAILQWNLWDLVTSVTLTSIASAIGKAELIRLGPWLGFSNVDDVSGQN